MKLSIHRQPPISMPISIPMVVLVVLFLLGAIEIDGFVPPRQPTLVSTKGRLQSIFPTVCLRAGRNDGEKRKKNSGDDGDKDSDDEDKQVSDFFFDMSKTSIDARSSMDAGIYELLGSTPEGSIAGTATNSSYQTSVVSPSPQSSTVVVMDWGCLLDALPYHIELGIHAARTTWPHLNDLCNFDTDRDWLENKLFAMSHVLGSPEGPDKSRHTACEYALATRLILEEQALDRNESTGKNGKYARKFHPRSEINGNNDFEKEKSRSRRPLTAGELAVNWREFIRATLIVKYARGPDGRISKQNPMEALEQAIEEYLSPKNNNQENEGFKTRMIGKSIPLFPQTKFALMNSSSKLVVRISHKFDNEIVARSLNKQLRLLPQECIAKTYKPENAIRRLFLHNTSKNESNSKHIVLLQKPDYRYELFNPNEAKNNQNKMTGQNDGVSDERCLQDIMKFTHHCENGLANKKNTQQPDDSELKTPSVVWIDSSWHRLQGLAPVFGDTIPGGRNGNRNMARCSFPNKEEAEESDALRKDKENHNVWLSLWLAEWPSQETSGTFSATPETEPRKNRISSSSSSENHEAAMVYPWTDSLSWETAEDILIPTTWGTSDNAFQ
eukprot:CAMPEP_0116132080 /NCGR_PEP_ID=MMETSP0329-20121206/9357_1 /TAXON_ID=697910 /ORGANISM="Pseudo-nitzschia arenysensis, Strain B593" /LENGTH=611 /DNA_ID=CAMNT_0003626571 /DNA_START=208 /DNA_END=2046 /DNA_ORIENTATION=-